MQNYGNYQSKLPELGGGEGSGSAINICCKTVSGLSLSLQRILYAGIFVPLLVVCSTGSITHPLLDRP